jgi:hypothetical protein
MDTRRSAMFCDASRNRFEEFPSPPGQHHAGAFLRERERSGLANSAPRAGDPRDLARQPLHKRPPSDMVIL